MIAARAAWAWALSLKSRALRGAPTKGGAPRVLQMIVAAQRGCRKARQTICFVAHLLFQRRVAGQDRLQFSGNSAHGCQYFDAAAFCQGRMAVSPLKKPPLVPVFACHLPISCRMGR